MLDWDAMMAAAPEADIGGIPPASQDADGIAGKDETAPGGSSEPLSHRSHVSPAKGARVETRQDDDRRRCTECVDRSEQGYCLAVQRGEVVAARGYMPVADLLRRCEGYKPPPSERDQRTGRERWPWLCSSDVGARGVAR